jgi:hypothetical protein
MKRLLLVLLVTATAITAAGQPTTASADCLYKRYHYYSDAAHSGLPCGHLDISCDDAVQTGCQTPSYTVSTGYCFCP